ncbi:MAG: hypothetical protein E6R12_07240 [Sphingomonadales bacterium]|nr:MAG: hypothetical protein E6R12_07240 [Sphingomonadales bacterium]
MALEKFNSTPLFDENDVWVIFDTAKKYVSFVMDDFQDDEVSYEVIQKCVRESVESHLKLVIEGG